MIEIILPAFEVVNGLAIIENTLADADRMRSSSYIAWLLLYLFIGGLRREFFLHCQNEPWNNTCIAYARS